MHKFLFGYYVLTSLGYISTGGITGSQGNSRITEELPHCSPKWLHHFLSPPAVNWGSHLSTSSVTLVMVYLFDDSYLSGYWVLSHCDLDLISLMANDIEHLHFYVLIGHWFIFFGEMFIYILCPFLNCVLSFYNLSCKSSLYSLDPSPLSDI